VSASDTILAARVEDRRFADVLFDEDRRDHEAALLRDVNRHYTRQLEAAQEPGA